MGTPSPGLSSSPPPLPPDVPGSLTDGTNEGTVSILDPRRFTPTLHASLVSEILTLRRELDSKHRFIENLESSLHGVKTENETLSDQLSQTSQASRAAKRQLQSLESGSFFALEDLMKENEDSKNAVSDLRNKLELSQKRVRSQEEDAARTHDSWERDREEWKNERRQLERRVHVLEGRLKAVVDELSANHADALTHEQSAGSDGEDDARDSGLGNESDTASVRSPGKSRGHARNLSALSISSYKSFRNSILSGTGAEEHGKLSGFSLADELKFDEEDEDHLEGELEDYPSEREEPTNNAPRLHQASYVDGRRKRISGSIHKAKSPSSDSIGTHFQLSEDIQRKTGHNFGNLESLRVAYVDTGVQFSPPLSPDTTHTSSPETESLAKVNGSPIWPSEIEANQCRKRVTINTGRQSATPAPISIPSIAIHPPLSAPSSPRKAVLPPATRNAACQADLERKVATCSASVQTEEIRVDKRPVRLPPNLLPAAVKKVPSVIELYESVAGQDFATKFAHTPQKTTTRSLRSRPLKEIPLPRPVLSAVPPTEHRYPGNNDNGPLAKDQNDEIRRPFRSSSLFAGFDTQDSDEGEGFHGAKIRVEEKEEDTVISDSHNGTLDGYTFSDPPTPVPEEREPSPVGVSATATVLINGRASISSIPPLRNQKSADMITRFARAVTPTAGNPLSDVRRAAMIQNGTAASLRQRSQSPSIARKDSLRKVRSVAAITRNGRSSPQKLSKSSSVATAPAAPRITQHPFVLEVDVASARPILAPQGSDNRPQPLRNSSQTGSVTGVSSVQHSSVVDSIAATMVGEWMWKYVRRRKSFNVSESPQEFGGDEVATSVAGSGIRHKRWVWLSPYEYAVMWRSKQPTSGSAMLVTIQSVLDVKDNTPAPKNAGAVTCFNRSILILTPARALKFTAVSQERHYLWLTALSFLAHSSQVGPENLTLSPTLPQEHDVSRHQAASLRRLPTREGSRTAKDSSRPVLKPIALGLASNMTGDSGLASPISDAAEPPRVPRFSHGRERSTTGPRIPPPPSTFRSYSSNAAPSLAYPVNPTLSLERPVTSTQTSTARQGSSGGRPSDVGSSVAARGDFVEPVGTVRMEAFVEATLRDEARPVSPHGLQPRVGRRRGRNQLTDQTTSQHRAGGVYDDIGFDPFKGF
ncbi:hypothetical protein B0A49_12000 [Cryomyces minteri]|uniref:Pleckstrin homology domain-containing protein n=1 Tax=Cryomyces minteri TaxID=331657 RepID=A0A4U0WIT1_9PEZI|nr:hypothetical protein B0A49_12000 [Cryomyces minteri]